jgi:mRNA interferase MazF
VPRAGVFDAQNVITIPHAKLIRRLGQLKAVQMSEVECAVCLWLGVPARTPP